MIVLNEDFKLGRFMFDANEYLDKPCVLWQLLQKDAFDSGTEKIITDRCVLLSPDLGFSMTVVSCDERDHDNLPGVYVKAVTYAMNDSVRDYHEHYMAIIIHVNPKIFSYDLLAGENGKDIIKAIVDDLLLMFFCMQSQYLESVDLSATDGFYVNSIISKDAINKSIQILDKTKEIVDDYEDLVDNPDIIPELMSKLVYVDTFSLLD